MTSPHAETALLQVFVVLAAVVFLAALLAAVTVFRNWLADRRESQARLDAMPKQAQEALDAGLDRLRTALIIPAQRAGGGR